MAKISYEDILEKDIMELLEIQDIPDENKKEIYQKLYETVENRAILRVDHEISEADFGEWKKMLESGDRDEADAFLKKRDIDIQRILIEETALLKAQLVFLLAKPEDQPDAQAGAPMSHVGAH